MAKKAKKYKAQMKKIDQTKNYSVDEALSILKDLPKANFDETVEVAMRLGIDSRKSDQNVRGSLILPNGTGKKVTVVTIAAGDAAVAAKEAGSDYVGSEDLIEKIKGGWIDFDVLIATPAAMKDLRPLGRVLGPRGLMPNPKTGTLTDDVAKATKDAKRGKIEYRADKNGCMHAPVGLISFSKDALEENCLAFVREIVRVRPAVIKGTYIFSCTVSTTMSPGIKIDIKDIVKV
ncbi:MAG: 50S ribosomal protein L1 [Verrucomicrobiota bacterium]|nr:50S ribosomal protein L1 [Verrucomicrobiota bacterium]